MLILNILAFINFQLEQLFFAHALFQLQKIHLPVEIVDDWKLPKRLSHSPNLRTNIGMGDCFHEMNTDVVGVTLQQQVIKAS
ncbi:hypothetical protein BH10CYA1_BH10CYA1_15740 [soil metagenome]